MKLIDLLNVIGYIYEVHIILNNNEVATVNFTDGTEPIITEEVETYLDYKVSLIEVGSYSEELRLWVNSYEELTITIIEDEMEDKVNE